MDRPTGRNYDPNQQRDKPPKAAKTNLIYSEVDGEYKQEEIILLKRHGKVRPVRPICPSSSISWTPPLSSLNRRLKLMPDKTWAAESPPLLGCLSRILPPAHCKTLEVGFKQIISILSRRTALAQPVLGQRDEAREGDKPDEQHPLKVGRKRAQLLELPCLSFFPLAVGLEPALPITLPAWLANMIMREGKSWPGGFPAVDIWILLQSNFRGKWEKVAMEWCVLGKFKGHWRDPFETWCCWNLSRSLLKHHIRIVQCRCGKLE